jgi:hypothetical protein
MAFGGLTSSGSSLANAPLPRGRQLRDAAEYITKLPKAEHDAEP